MSARKIVQIHRMIGPENAKWQGTLITTVVCDDGTAWEQWNDCAWVELPPIPQDTPTPHATDTDTSATAQGENDA